ncbi:alpha/beta hydrolase [Pseudonocardiaceae bacterium YIM PH 21723]|nr:alpha/beta hydrolase [Pseudonocardiaceae bacterium YIM PH 21723]
MTCLTLDTPHGPARAELHSAEEGSAALLLGHGAGGGIDAPDLVAVTRAATAAGVHVALIQQPYRVAGRRAPAPAKHLDTAWLAVADALAEHFGDLPLLFGGRSSGARVACRTAADGGAAAVLCLAFPVHPPGKPEKSRMDELNAVKVPLLVVQGRTDAFGQPDPAPHHEVVSVAGDHSLKADTPAVARAVGEWLTRVVRPLN